MRTRVSVRCRGWHGENTAAVVVEGVTMTGKCSAPASFAASRSLCAKRGCNAIATKQRSSRWRRWFGNTRHLGAHQPPTSYLSLLRPKQTRRTDSSLFGQAGATAAAERAAVVQRHCLSRSPCPHLPRPRIQSPDPPGPAWTPEAGVAALPQPQAPLPCVLELPARPQLHTS